MNKNPIFFAYVFAVLNATIIGFSFLFTKLAVSTAGPVDTLACRFVFAFLFYSGFLAVRGRMVPWNTRRVIRLLPLIGLYPIAFFTFQAYGLLYASSAEGGIITATTPVFTALLAAAFIKESVNFKQMISIAVSVAGVLYIALHKSGAGENVAGQSAHFLGLSLLVLSCVATAGYTVVNRVMVRSFSASEISFYMMFLGAAFFFPLALGIHFYRGTPLAFFSPFRKMEFLFATLYLGLFASLLTSLLASEVLKRIASARLAVFMNLSTVIAIVAGYVFLREEVHAYHIFGTGLILLGVLGTNFFADKEKRARDT